MAQTQPEQHDVSKITLFIKTTSNQRYEISVLPDCSVIDLKKEIQKASPDGIDPDLQKLIYKGRILKDNEKINSDGLSIKDKHSIILVKSRRKRTVPKSNNNTDHTNDVQVPAPNVTLPSQNTDSNNNSNSNNNPNNNNNTNMPQNPFMAMGGLNGLNGLGGLNGLNGMNNMNMNNMDPDRMLNMMNNPFFQQMTDSLLQNPQILQGMMQNNPMIQQAMQNNPAMQNQLNMMIQNPEMMRAAFNMQRGLLQMRQAQNNSNNNNSNSNGNGNAQQQSSSQTSNNGNSSNSDAANNPFLQMFGGGLANNQSQGTNSNGNSNSNSNANSINPFGMNNAMNPFMMMNQSQNQQQPQTQQNNVQPEILYRSQLSQLNSMGFNDANANIQALIRTGGNVQAAIDLLLNQ